MKTINGTLSIQRDRDRYVLKIRQIETFKSLIRDSIDLKIRAGGSPSDNSSSLVTLRGFPWKKISETGIIGRSFPDYCFDTSEQPICFNLVFYDHSFGKAYYARTAHGILSINGYLEVFTGIPVRLSIRIPTGDIIRSIQRRRPKMSYFDSCRFPVKGSSFYFA